MTQHTTELYLFTKAPRPGEVKTRLARVLGDEQAAALHAAFLKDLLTTTTDFASRAPHRHITLACADERPHPTLDALLAGDWNHPNYTGATARYIQRGADLGARLEAAVRHALSPERGGEHKMVIIGSDSPTLTPELLEQAERALDTHQVVIGPSFDGGYYLIGMSSLDSMPVFRDVTWSTDQVLSQTLARCAAHGLSVTLLPFWYDVDTLEDLRLLRAHLLEYLVASEQGPHYGETTRLLRNFSLP